MATSGGHQNQAYEIDVEPRGEASQQVSQAQEETGDNVSMSESDYKETTTIELPSSGASSTTATTTTTAVPDNNSDETDGLGLAGVSAPGPEDLLGGGIKRKLAPASSGGGYVRRRRDEHFEITWRQLDYVLESKWYELSGERKPILSSLNGTIKSGELSAILGPSGAGKSTLIDCLLGKHERGLSGRTQVTFKDAQCELERRRKRPLRIATIPQHDHLLESLTVMETFMFASKIKNAHLSHNEEQEEEDENDDTEEATKLQKESSSGRGKRRRRPFDHFANVQRVIQQLNLSSCASLRCSQLSGGQYKRVSIGQELLSRPDLMILDEPTSGLDSVTCFQTINALRQLIDSSPYPMAIVATIHQPDVEVFELFHKCYVIAAGGRPIYEGPTDGIFDTIRLGLSQVATRRRQLAQWDSQLAAVAGKHASRLEPEAAITRPAGDQLDMLRAQIEPARQQLGSNPARLIVEVAANEYGFEIISAMNEIHLQEYTNGGGGSCSTGTGGLPSSSSAAASTCGADLSASSSSDITDTGTTATATTNDQPMLVVGHNSKSCGGMLPTPVFDYEANDPANRRPQLDRLLCLVTANMSQRRSASVYLKHLVYHTHRSWLTIVRDPMLFSLQVLLHIMVPLLISYCFQGHRADACPRVGPLDVIHEAYRPGNVLDDLNKELRVVFENLGYMFFQIYVIIFAAVCVTSLTYPLAMHVLLKEYRNGWYSLSSYFLGRTLADLPVPTFNVVLAMGISYHLTGQPMSPYAWRFVSVASLTVLATLVAQTQGLMFGAMLMNAPQSAVFVAPASTAPLVVVSGFLIRIKSLPYVLQWLSQFSYFTHLLNGFIVSRYGFNRCPCQEEDFSLNDDERAHEIPQQARAIINLWADSFAAEQQGLLAGNSSDLAAPTVVGSNSTTADLSGVDLVGKLVGTITRAKTFGYEMTDCSQVKPFTMLDYQLNDSDLTLCFLALGLMLILFRILTYVTLSWKINSSI